MNEANFLNYNGKIKRNNEAIISADNRSFRYGDGFFETMKMKDGKIILAEHHFERMFASLSALKFIKPAHFSTSFFQENIIWLAQKNGHSKCARIRLTIFRGDGGLYDAQNHQPNFIIQTWDLNNASNMFNENGLVTDIYEDAKKSCDQFSNIKSNNFLPYIMAAIWAKENKLNDALLLNSQDRIADATIANIFIIKNKKVFTPALSEGCVAGTMRRFLIENFAKEKIDFEEGKLEIGDLLNADELFFTNAVYGIKWVRQLSDKVYSNSMAATFYKKFITPLFS